VDLTAALQAPSSLERRRVDRATGRLTGTRCADCGTVSWPGRAVCHHCGSAATSEFALSSHGELITCTTVWISRPGLVPPFTLGQIDLPEGARVFGHVRSLPEHARVPLPVQLVMAPEDDAIPPFWFEPTEAP